MIPYPDPELTDGVVLLRPPTEEDVSAIAKACGDREIARFIPMMPRPYGVNDAQGWLHLQEEQRQEEADLSLLISEPGSRRLLGSIGLHLDRDVDPPSAAVGFWVEKNARGRGLATRGVNLLTPWANEDLGIAELRMHILPDNAASQRVAERCGFTIGGLRAEEVDTREGKEKIEMLIFEKKLGR